MICYFNLFGANNAADLNQDEAVFCPTEMFLYQPRELTCCQFELGDKNKVLLILPRLLSIFLKSLIVHISTLISFGTNHLLSVNIFEPTCAV